MREADIFKGVEGTGGREGSRWKKEEKSDAIRWEMGD